MRGEATPSMVHLNVVIIWRRQDDTSQNSQEADENLFFLVESKILSDKFLKSFEEKNSKKTLTGELDGRVGSF